VPGKACAFSNPSSANQPFTVVAPSGVFVQRYTASDGSGGARFLIGFPEQTVALADLAGDWNMLEFDTATGAAPAHRPGRVGLGGGGPGGGLGPRLRRE
jgi:hypothetical protein